jgi:ABC-type transport system substrate-binding protein
MNCFFKGKLLLIVLVLLLSGASGCSNLIKPPPDETRTSSPPVNEPRTSSPPIVNPTNYPVPADLVGTWRGSVQYGKIREWVYSFNSNGTLKSQNLDEQGQVIDEDSGTYTFKDGKIVVSWLSSATEEASITAVNANEFQYAILSHTDQKQIGLSVLFRRSALVPVSPPTIPPEKTSIVGAWRGSVRYGAVHEWVYSFNSDGTIINQNLDEQGQVINEENGTYTFKDSKIVVSWPPSVTEEASITWGNANEFQYAISSHTDQKQIGLSVLFRRSDLVPVSPPRPEPTYSPTTPSPTPTYPGDLPDDSHDGDCKTYVGGCND